MGFREYAEMGLKWVQKWVFVLTRFDPLFAPQNPLLTRIWTHFGPFTKTLLKPTLNANKLFSKKGT